MGEQQRPAMHIIRRADGEEMGDYAFFATDGPTGWDVAEDTDHDEDTTYEILACYPVARRKFLSSTLCPTCDGEGDGCPACAGTGEHEPPEAELLAPAAPERPQPAELHGWITAHDVLCVVCPGCGFTFDADHTGPGVGYSCPLCELDAALPVRERPQPDGPRRDKLAIDVEELLIDHCGPGGTAALTDSILAVTDEYAAAAFPVRDRPVDGPPVHLLLDLWQAIGGDSEDFHPWWAADPSFPDRWSQMVAAINGNISDLTADSNPPAGKLLDLAISFQAAADPGTAES